MSGKPFQVVPPVAPVASDTADIESLLLDAKLGDGIVDVSWTSVPVGKPRSFFSVHPDASYRRLAEVYTHKVEGTIDEVTYLIDKPMRGRLDGARPVTLVTVIDRQGSPRLWVIPTPPSNGRDFEAWVSQRMAAKQGMGGWIRLHWQNGRYVVRKARAGYAPAPDFSKLPSFSELLKLAFGEKLIVRDEQHPIFLEVMEGIDQPLGDDDDAEDIGDV